MKSIGERIYPGSIETASDYILYLKHIFAYEHTKKKLAVGVKVLEVGCGEGYGTSTLSEGRRDVTGIDIDIQTIDEANKKYGDRSCKYILFDGKKIPFENDSFDAIVSFQVIEHVPDDKYFLNEIKRVLKPSGKLYLATPNRKYRLRPTQKPWNPFHLREYSAEQFSSLCSSIFDDFNLYGVSATKEAYSIEVNRVYPSRFMTPLRQVTKIIQNSIQIFKGGDKAQLKLAKKKYSVNDFYIVESGLDDSLDLFAICTKKQ